MPIKKQEYYEGAALHILIRCGGVERIIHRAPFFIINSAYSVLLKYSTKNRTPWGFTFTRDEQIKLQEESKMHDVRIALICGWDGIATFEYETLVSIASPRESAIHVGCARSFGNYYRVTGPDGEMQKKISPSTWQKLLENGGTE